MKALFTGGLGDFIGAECFMTEQEKDSVTEILWATRNRQEIRSAIELKDIFPSLEKETILFDDFSDIRPTRPWQEGDRFMNIGTKIELNTKCKLNLSDAELDSISDHSLDATLQNIFSGKRRWVSSRIAHNMQLPDITKFNLPEKYVVIHPWSDNEITGREFDDSDWESIFRFLARFDLKAVVVNQSKKNPPKHDLIIDLTNQTSLKETFRIVKFGYAAILCSSSIACFATKVYPKDTIWIKGGHEYIFTEWATYFYHGPFINPKDVTFKNLSILDHMLPMDLTPSIPSYNLDQGYISLIQ